jgi:Family of unknown function (DUF6174)
MWRRLVVPVVIATIVAASVVAFEWAHRPKSVAAAKHAWRQAGIENYTLDIVVDGCMGCGGPEPPRYSVVVTNGEKTSEADPPGQKPGYGPTVEDLFRMIEANGPNEFMTVTYNDVGVPTEIRVVNPPNVADGQYHETITFTET